MLSSYQSVSGAGQQRRGELLGRSGSSRRGGARWGIPCTRRFPSGELFGKTIAYNVVAKIGEFEDDGYTGEESKMMAEPRKILDPRPARRGHQPCACRSRGSRGLDPGGVRPADLRAQAREAFVAAPGVELRDDPAQRHLSEPAGLGGPATSRWSAGSARCRGRANALKLFSCADNLRKGAALDAVQIADTCSALSVPVLVVVGRAGRPA